jgi:hypothetical protein
METTYTEKQMSNEVNEIAEALSNAQSQLDNASKDSKGFGYNYSDLASVINVAKPILSMYKLSVTQLIGEATETHAKITTILSHKSGQFFRSTMTIPLFTMKGTNACQSFGAAISYGRRYSYQAILGMASEDSDASSGKSTGSKTTTTTETKTADKPKTSSPSAWS